MAVVTVIDLDMTILVTVTSAMTLTMTISRPINTRPDFGGGVSPDYCSCCSRQSVMRRGPTVPLSVAQGMTTSCGAKPDCSWEVPLVSE